MSAGTGAITITVLVDNAAPEGLASEHGFSAWIQHLDPDPIMPCYCTGTAALEEFEQVFGDVAEPGSAGAALSFSMCPERQRRRATRAYAGKGPAG